MRRDRSAVATGRLRRDRRPAAVLLALLAGVSSRGIAAQEETPALDTAAPSPALAASRAYRSQHGVEILSEFSELLAIPNVATDLENIRRNARFILEAFERRGARMELLEVPEAPPVVFGELPAEGPEAGKDAPTLVLYAHYDGQPVDPDRWTHGPWSPTLYSRSLEAGGWPLTFPRPGQAVDPEWRLYARSAGDDKAPIQALLSALDALQEAKVPRTIHLKLFFEGEEEAGSPHLQQVVSAARERLAADAWLFLDGPVHQSGRPQVFFGVRGITGLDLTVYGARRYLHSGHYGNWAPDPSLLLAHLLASMKSPDGEVTIAGFYDNAPEWGEAERQAVASSPPFEEELRRELGIAVSEGGNETRYLERLMRPSLTVRGLGGGPVGAAASNVIPPEATASLDLRLVPGNDPDRMLRKVEDHIAAQGFHLVRGEPTEPERRDHPRLVRVVRRGGYPAVSTRMDLPLARALAEAATFAAGEPVIRTPLLGGSLPFYAFTGALGPVPLIGLPIANHDNNQHGPDENLRLANLWYGMDLFATILTLPPERWQ
jgi:acetylornithine deacetylase/succinyl-diaminopimelate desuccinylase-like protein